MFRRITKTVFSSAALAAVGAALLGCTPHAEEQDVSNSSGTVDLAVLGDSYAAGHGLGKASDSFAHVLAQQACWTLYNNAQSGTGYVSAAHHVHGYRAYPDRVDDLVAHHPLVVVIQGSDNDIYVPTDAIVAGARTTYSRLHRALPQARIVAVGPVTVPGTQTALLTHVRDALVGATAESNVDFVDPIALQWLPDEKLFMTDREHPTMRGHQELANDILVQLHAAGIPDACARADDASTDTGPST